MTKKTRRDFLRSGWKVGGALLAVAAGWTTFEALRPFATGASAGTIRLGDVGSFQEGTATYFPEGRLYLVNAKRHFFALSQKCPHLGCRVPFCESSGRFECPCHGSVFDLAGEYIAGPSPRGMDRYALKAEGNSLVVDTGSPESGPDRGTKDFLEPPKGPSCVKGA